MNEINDKITTLVTLEGDYAKEFEKYKNEENLTGNVQTAYKLICDRLNEIKKNRSSAANQESVLAQV